MIIAGIDYSINSPGICIYNTDSGQLSFDNILFYFNQHSISKKERVRRKPYIDKCTNVFQENCDFEYSSLEQRYFVLADWASSIINLHNVTDVVLESYALHSVGKVFNIAEATSILKQLLFINGINIHLITPTENKKLFTGKGNAKKCDMIAEFNKINDINISETIIGRIDYDDSPISDLVDSYALINSFLKKRVYI